MSVGGIQAAPPPPPPPPPVSNNTPVGNQGGNPSNVGGGDFKASLTNASSATSSQPGAQANAFNGPGAVPGPGEASATKATSPLFGSTPAAAGKPPGEGTGFDGVKKGLEGAGASEDGLKAFDKATGLLNGAAGDALKDGKIDGEEIGGIKKALGEKGLKELGDLAKGPLAEMKGLTPEFDEFMKGLEGFLGGKDDAASADFLNKGLTKAEEAPAAGEMPPAAGAPPAGAPPAGAPPAGAPPAGAPPAGAPPAGAPPAGGPPPGGEAGGPEEGGPMTADKLKEAIAAADKNGDGIIDEEELKALAEQLGIDPEQLMKLLDADGDGEIKVDEAQKGAEKLMELDEDGNGELGKEEMTAEKIDKLIEGGMGEEGEEGEDPLALSETEGAETAGGETGGETESGAGAFASSDPGLGGLIPTELPKAA